MFQGHTDQNFFLTHHKSFRIYPVYAFFAPLTLHDIPDILGQSHYFYYLDWFSWDFTNVQFPVIILL